MPCFSKRIILQSLKEQLDPEGEQVTGEKEEEKKEEKKEETIEGRKLEERPYPKQVKDHLRECAWNMHIALLFFFTNLFLLVEVWKICSANRHISIFFQ